MRDISVNFVVALASATVIVAGYHVLTVRHAPPPIQFGALDVVAIYNQNFTQAAKRISAPGVTKAEQDKVLKDGEEFMRQLNTVLMELPIQCGCIVLNRETIVGGKAVLDLTPIVLKRLKLAPT